MKTGIFFSILSLTLAAFILFPVNSLAQQESSDQAKGKKTITIHVTKEVDGNTIVIDTTVVTDGDFDADAFLEEKGVMNDMPQAGKNIDKHIVIRHPGEEFGWSDSESNSPDTIIIDEDRVIVFNDKFDMPFPPSPHAGMPFDFNFNMPGDFPHFEGQQFEDLMEGMAKTFGLENVMPFGEMKQVVVKKKRNGKKLIITFEDRDKEGTEQGQGHKKKEEKVIIYKNGEQVTAPQNEEKVIINGESGENIVIRRIVKKNENGDQVIIDEEVGNPTPEKKEKKVIIITEEGTK